MLFELSITCSQYIKGSDKVSAICFASYCCSHGVCECVFAVAVGALKMCQLDLLYSEITGKWYKSLWRGIHYFLPELKGLCVKKVSLVFYTQ